VLTGDRVTKWVTIATDSGGRQRTLPDDRSQVKFVAARAVQTASWLRDEEATQFEIPAIGSHWSRARSMGKLHSHVC
jgi:hypothetical protein